MSRRSPVPVPSANAASTVLSSDTAQRPHCSRVEPGSLTAIIVSIGIDRPVYSCSSKRTLKKFSLSHSAASLSAALPSRALSHAAERCLCSVPPVSSPSLPQRAAPLAPRPLALLLLRLHHGLGVAALPPRQTALNGVVERMRSAPRAPAGPVHPQAGGRGRAKAE